jgi:hypothetical protein
VRDLRELRHLAKLPRLAILWLSENPCAKVANYRLLVIKALPLLTRLDN